MTDWALDHGDVRILLGDAREQLGLLDAGSVQCIVTSPPFWGLRDYGTGTWEGGDPDCDHGAAREARRAETREPYFDGGSPRGTPRDPVRMTCPCGARRVDQQIGLEPTPEEWCAELVDVFRACRRVLRDDGVLWLEVGDTYAGGGRGGHEGHLQGTPPQGDGREYPRPTAAGVKPKDLVGAPWMLAFALRADGWYLRSDTIWARPNPMPESITDRPTKAHSYVFLLAKSARYFYDADAIREAASEVSLARYERGSRYDDPAEVDAVPYAATRPRGNVAGANARSVWSIATEPTPFAHFATFPQALVRKCILAGTSERGRCPECGGPWRRVTERTDDARTYPAYDGKGRFDENGVHERRVNPAGGSTLAKYQTSTTGWEPTCECDPHEPVPCVVLDPFMGSATTGLVARKLGRHAVGVELNPEYLEIARERLSQQSLLT